MENILSYIINQIGTIDGAITIKQLTERYLDNILMINENSGYYCSKFIEFEKKIKSIIKKENAKFIRDSLEEPFLIKGARQDLIKKSETFKILEESITLNKENCDEFADRIGKELLISMGCNDEDTFITSDKNDEGIDYWGRLRFENLISDKETYILIIGQVKKYNNSIPIEDLREFVGSVNTALESGVFGKDVNRSTPHIIQFVTTGDISKGGQTVADINKITVITKRHLSKMGLLNI